MCPACGVRCPGQFKGCAEVWAARTEVGSPVSVTRSRPGPVVKAPTVRSLGTSQSRPTPETSSPVVAPLAVDADPAPVKRDAGTRKAKDVAVRLRAEAEELRETQQRSFERMTAELDDRAREIEERAHDIDDIGRDLADRARQIDDRARDIDERAAAHLRALEHDRASLPGELRKSIAGVLPGMVAEAVRIALDARRIDAASRPSVPDEVRRSVAGLLPAAVADAVDLAIAARLAELPSPDQAEAARSRAEHDPIVVARQRSLEKRIDGLTRRAQEIDDRISTHLRAIDDDRAALSELARRQGELAQSVAGAAGDHERLVTWVNQAVPLRVEAAVKSTLDSHAAALGDHTERAERARADTEARAKAIQDASERIMETLYRRDQEIDDRAAAHLRVLDDARAALAAILDSGRDQVAQAVIEVLPAMIDTAVRTSMAHYTAERRAPGLEMATRLRADSDIMRESLQRSFEKMMESLAARDQELDDRAIAHLKAVELEKGELAGLRAQVAESMAEAVPVMVAQAVGATEAQHRAEVAETHHAMERLRVDSEATNAELRAAVAELRAALADRSEALERQAAASEHALETFRAAMARPATEPGGRVRPAVITVSAGPADPSSPGEPSAGDAPTDDRASGRRTAFGRSSVPQARRVERRMLKIDDGDGGDGDAPSRPVDRRQAALSDLLDIPDRLTPPPPK